MGNATFPNPPNCSQQQWLANGKILQTGGRHTRGDTPRYRLQTCTYNMHMLLDSERTQLYNNQSNVHPGKPGIPKTTATTGNKHPLARRRTRLSRKTISVYLWGAIPYHIRSQPSYCRRTSLSTFILQAHPPAGVTIGHLNHDQDSDLTSSYSTPTTRTLVNF